MNTKASIVSITCGVVLTGAAGMFSGSLSAQSLSTRITAVRNGTAAFSYPTRAGVCGSGKSIVIRKTDNSDDTYYMEQYSDNGTNITSWSSRSSDNRIQDCQPGPARVQLISSEGRITKVIVTVGNQTSNNVGTVTDLGTVTGQEASHTLLSLASGNTTVSEKVASRAVFAAILSDATQETTTELLGMSRQTSLPEEVRKNAINWMNLSEDPRVVTRLKELLADRGEDVDVRETALYGLSRHSSPEIVQLLLNNARSADQKKLKESAVFWLGQMAGDKATAGLKSILDDDSEDMEVRDAAVFAISNQKNENSVSMLMDVATKSKEPHLRRTAMFWLGKHSDDPRVLKLFEDILTHN